MERTTDRKERRVTCVGAGTGRQMPQGAEDPHRAHCSQSCYILLIDTLKDDGEGKNLTVHGAFHPLPSH